MKEKSNISKIGLIYIFVIITIIALVLEFITLQRYTIDDITYDTIVNSRKQLLKGHVERTFNDIELLRDDLTDQYQVYVTMLGNEIRGNLADTETDFLSWEDFETLTESIISHYQFEKESIYNHLEVLVYDSINESIVYCSQDTKDFDLFMDAYDKSSVKYEIDIDEVILYINLQEDVLDNLVKERIKDWIRELRIEGSDYLWINEVIRFEGGHDYGIRLVHPNLPETEGIFLSTETEDIKGNKPYQTELEGIKAEGEVYFRYYFKEFESEIISEKMTYAKLYEPYNWIIATGIYMSDIEDLKVADDIHQRNLIIIRIIFILSIIALVILMYLAIRLVRRSNNTLMKEKEEYLEYSQSMNKLLDKVQILANKDELTGVLNRRGLFERMEEEFSRFKRHNSKMIIVMIDIDYFKAINDKYGHDAGDEVLRYFAQLLLKSIRKEDILGRLGGDEFLFVMPYSSLEDGIKIFEDIQVKLAQEPFMYKGKKIRLTLSAGITEAKSMDDSISVLKRTDKAMYKSKKAGRNRISVAD